ncbi:SNF2 family N-terminal domain-containing protein [Tirmania nivea]|nr:SNF2 family N-terminal domain-containing protein [Tirmania nivea]
MGRGISKWSRKTRTRLWHEAVPYQLLEKQPAGVMATMKPYQIAGLSFLVWLYNNGASGLLGDEMGLGKTLQTLSLFSYLTEHHPSPPGYHRPFLVVCPLSVLSSWMNECKRWTPHLRAMRFHGPVIEKERMKKLAELGELDTDGESVHPYDVIVTTYEVFEKEVSWFRRAFVWRYVVLDEGHKIKNEQTQISLALQGLSAEYRLVLTGTPLQNNLKELWALLHFIMPEVFLMNTQTKFMDAFNLTLGKVDKKVMDDSRKLLELIMLRRMKDSKGVNLGLPPKREVVLSLPLTPMQKFWYKRLLTRLDKGLLEDLFKGAKEKEEAALQEERQALRSEEEQLENVEEGLESENPEKIEDSWKEAKTIMQQSIQAKTTGWQKLMNLLMQLRKCCNHPYLLPGAAPEPYFSGMHVMLASSKFIILDRLIDELCIKQGRKVLIFSGFTKMLDVVEEFLALKGGNGEKFHYSRLDGSTCRARRTLEIRLFNADPQYKVMLLSTRAGGLGINLATASDVVMLESDWNPQADLQAQARAHRIGQVNEVTVYRLITQGTVEEQMMGRIRKKLYLSAKVTESMRDIHSTSGTAPGGKKGKGKPRMNEEEDNMPNLTAGQLMSLVRRGAQAIAKPEIDPEDMLKWNWDEMLDRTKDYDMTLEPNDQQGKKKPVEAQAEAVKGMQEIAPGVAAVPGEDLETKWLSEMEKVETRLFEGREHKKREAEEHAKLVLDITRGSRRDGKNRVVMIDGHAVLKETIGCGEWEAVPTISGKGETIFSEPVKKKRDPFEHQDYCQVCFDGGTISLCSGCPRAYHVGCLPPRYKTKAKNTILDRFYCPQHQCADCDQKTSNAGGMLFRCRWCENAYCEDCMDWDGTNLLGDNLVEMDLMQYGEQSTVHWIKCVQCIEQHKGNADYQKMCDELAADWDAQMRRVEEEARLRELEAEKSASGGETPGVGGSLISTQVTTTAATSVGSDEDEDEEKKVVISLSEEGEIGEMSALDSRANSQASSRISRRIAVTSKVSYTPKKQKSGPRGSKKTLKVGGMEAPKLVVGPAIAGVKRKEGMDGGEVERAVKRRR